MYIVITYTTSKPLSTIEVLMEEGQQIQVTQKHKSMSKHYLATKK